MQQTTQIQPSFTLKTREGGVASADERADEVVIGVGPAFDKHQHHTLIDMPHGAQMVRPKFMAKAALFHIKETKHVVQDAEPVTLHVDLVRE